MTVAELITHLQSFDATTEIYEQHLMGYFYPSTLPIIYVSYTPKDERTPNAYAVLSEDELDSYMAEFYEFDAKEWVRWTYLGLSEADRKTFREESRENFLESKGLRPILVFE